ncbi:MAG: hypothetical protein K2H09_04050 [Treponemataceae bacterium]|nr:hypothetical protein [Treponemataceae bacterium]
MGDRRTAAAVLCVCAAVFFPALFSCSDSEPRLSSASGFVVFDYEADGVLPVMKLAAFAETDSDVRRVDKVVVSSRQNQYEWTADEPLVFSSEGRQWAGCADFVCPGAEPIPRGFYDLYYTDGAESTVQGMFVVSYPDGLAALPASRLGEQEALSRERFAVFDEERKLLYFGSRQQAWKDDADVFVSFERAAFFRRCLGTEDGSVLCLLPPVFREQDGGGVEE